MNAYYPIIKHAHMIFAAISIALLAFRFISLQMNAAFMQKKWPRIVPPVNDTFLLATGIALIVITAQYPLTPSSLWLTEKLAILVVYIFFGFIAMQRKPLRPAIRYGAFALAMVCFLLVYYLAKTKAVF